MVSAFYVAFAGAYHASFIAGTCLVLISLAQDLKKDLLTVNRLAKHKRNRERLFKKISRLVRFHSDCKQLRNEHIYSMEQLTINNENSFMFSSLIDDFTDVTGLVFLSFFTWSYFSICGTFLKINYEIVAFLWMFLCEPAFPIFTAVYLIIVGSTRARCSFASDSSI